MFATTSDHVSCLFVVIDLLWIVASWTNCIANCILLVYELEMKSQLLDMY